MLGKYVRDEQVITLPEAIRKLSKLPASNLKIRNRGELAEGYFADIVVFDPSTVSDHASFSDPHQYSTGMAYVIVNGEIIRDGEHTAHCPARLSEARWRGWQQADEPDTQP